MSCGVWRTRIHAVEYKNVSLPGMLAACFISLIATCGAMLSPERHQELWIALFALAFVTFGAAVNRPVQKRD